ncbi:unnamed protein product [Phyllotreta striolata]|uniref:C2H2-type domain-containing protein n=1 Tax=Phyllotreta striolata TaxID=444603 RepID=A0A9N9XV57_PHYSR|nr:unnamed protein product [Phyllotreta striolata]
MNNLDNFVINIYNIAEDGRAASMVRYEMSLNNKNLVTKSYFCHKTVCFDPESMSGALYDNKLTLNYRQLKVEEAIKCTRQEEDDPVGGKQMLNIPTMIRCQNCETNFPTKYQYQRHQCEFNAEKVILKSEVACKESDQVQVKHVCLICNKQFVNASNLVRHLPSHDNNQENICEYCNKHFISENRLRIHKENHCKKAGDISKFYRSDVTVWKCKNCHEVFSSPLTANYHVSICKEVIKIEAHREEETPETDEKPPNDPAGVLVDKNLEKMLTELLLQCEFCNRTYAEKNLLLVHQRKHTTSKNYECTNCSQAFDSYIAAAQHWMKKCSEYVSLFYLPKLTYCEYCDRTFKSHELLYTHKIKKKHYTVKIHLPGCANAAGAVPSDEKFVNNKEILNKLIEDVLITLDVPLNKINTYSAESNKENLESTGEQDATEKKKRGRKRKWPANQNVKMKKLSLEVDKGFKYQCERCVKIFSTVLELECHREKEHASNFACEECGQVLHSAKALTIHSRAHKSLKPYVCETCGRSYSQTSHLWQHMRFHQGIKPFACPHEGCEARYTIRPDLKDHIRKAHTRERPFKCNVCDKCFLTGSVYYQHRLIHTNDRRYACDLCPKRFFRADALNNHRRIHTDERPYPCHICRREFRQKGDRNKHLRTQHPDSVVNN